MQGDSGRLGLACVTAEAGSIGSHIAQRTGERSGNTVTSRAALIQHPGLVVVVVLRYHTLRLACYTVLV